MDCRFHSSQPRGERENHVGFFSSALKRLLYQKERIFCFSQPQMARKTLNMDKKTNRMSPNMLRKPCA